MHPRQLQLQYFNRNDEKFAAAGIYSSHLYSHIHMHAVQRAYVHNTQRPLRINEMCVKHIYEKSELMLVFIEEFEMRNEKKAERQRNELFFSFISKNYSS